MSPHFSFCFRLGHGIQSAVPVTTKLCVGGLQGFQRRIYRCETTNLLRRWIVLFLRFSVQFPFASSKTSCFFLERRTSLDLRNSRSLRMFSLEFLSFRYRCRLLWNDCGVAGSYDPPSFFFITIRNWHIKMLSSCSGISSIFLASPTSRKNLFQTWRSYSVFFTVFFLHTRHRKLSLLLVFFPLRTDIFHLIRVIKLALAVVWVHAEINICRKKWKVYTISINLVNKKLHRPNWCNLITQRIGYRPLWAGRMGRILPALGTNQIAGFLEYRPLTTWEKN